MIIRHCLHRKWIVGRSILVYCLPICKHMFSERTLICNINLANISANWFKTFRPFHIANIQSRRQHVVLHHRKFKHDKYYVFTVFKLVNGLSTRDYQIVNQLNKNVFLNQLHCNYRQGQAINTTGLLTLHDSKTKIQTATIIQRFLGHFSLVVTVTRVNLSVMKSHLIRYRLLASCCR